MLPKSQLNQIKLRHQAIGNERRLNMTKIVLDHAPNFPLSVSLKDIDAEFEKWVKEDLDISFDGKKLPTFKLFSNQRINEYAQAWNYLDETGNLLMNFKAISRDNNPKHGENQGNWYNIPGNRDYPMFMVPVLQENGQHAYDMYSMKQPYSIDLDYTLSVVTNKYELINEMNQLVNYQFKAIDCYIAPNGHFMPMTLEDVSDESEYSLDDRKYYSQTYKIKIKAYLIREEDFKVTHLPSRVKVRVLGLKDKKKSKLQDVETTIKEEDYIADECCLREEYDPYYNKLLTLTIKFPSCQRVSDFVIDTDMVIKTIETENVYDFVMSINDEFQDLEENISDIYNGDNIHFEIERDDVMNDSAIIIKGFDPNCVLDERKNPESSLDDEITEEEITIE